MLFMALMAFWASSSLVYRTKPKPRLRPVSRSLTTTCKSRFDGQHLSLFSRRRRRTRANVFFPPLVGDGGGREGAHASVWTPIPLPSLLQLLRHGLEKDFNILLLLRRHTPQTSGGAWPPQCARQGLYKRHLISNNNGGVRVLGKDHVSFSLWRGSPYPMNSFDIVCDDWSAFIFPAIRKRVLFSTS